MSDLWIRFPDQFSSFLKRVVLNAVIFVRSECTLWRGWQRRASFSTGTVSAVNTAILLCELVCIVSSSSSTEYFLVDLPNLLVCYILSKTGNYVFDREGRYGDRFFCTAHSNTMGLYSWKKYEQELAGEPTTKPSLGHRPGHPMTTPTSQQVSRRQKKFGMLLNGLNGLTGNLESPSSSQPSSTPSSPSFDQKEMYQHQQHLDMLERDLLMNAAPIKSSFYIFFAFILFAISYIFNPPEIHDFIVANLDLVSVT